MDRLDRLGELVVHAPWTLDEQSGPKILTWSVADITEAEHEARKDEARKVALKGVAQSASP